MTRPRVGATRRGSKPRRALRFAPVALVLTALLAGCAGGPAQPADPADQRHRHLDEKGPLSASSGEGAFAFPPLDSSSSTPYRSFGHYYLCAWEEGADLQLERVTYQAGTEPLNVEFWLRTVNADDIEMVGEYASDEYLAFASALGRPPDYEGDEIRYAGTHTTDIVGTKITRACDNDEFTGTLTMLIVTMKVDERGAHLPGLTIEYTANGQPYALDTKWEMVVCGTAVTFETCDGAG